MRQALRARQTGIAALTAILVVAIATVLAVNLLWQTSVDLRRTETLLLQDQARQYDLGGEEFAKSWLAKDFREDGPDGPDNPGEDWARPQMFDVEAGRLEGYLVDQQGRFNLNGLVGADGKPIEKLADQFERLLTLLPLERPLDSSTARALVEAAIDWIDPDQSPLPAGAEDDQYTSREPPYRPANFWFTSTSELLAVEGYTPEIYVALRPHVSALPPQGDGQPWRLNVNTATPVVLRSLVAGGAGLQDIDLTAIGPWEDIEEFKQDFPDAAQIPVELPLGVGSRWFLLTATATIGTAQATMYSLLERNGEVVRTRLRTFDAN